METLEYIKSKYNGEIPYAYGRDEVSKLMRDYAEQREKELITGLKRIRVWADREVQSFIDELLNK